MTYYNPYATPDMVALRCERGATVCVDVDCNLSGGFAHVGPCEPCDCPDEHAKAECPNGSDFPARVHIASRNQCPQD